MVSFAHYHANFWSEIWRDSAEAEFIGIWDADEIRGREMAAKYNVSFITDLEDLLSRVDAIGLCNETSAHADVIEKAAAKGVHVLCEKPLATSREAYQKITSVVNNSGIVFQQSYPKRHDPINHEIKRLIDEGALGRITLMRVRHCHYYGLDPEFKDEWHTNASLSGGGALIDEGVHGADLIRWFMGDPVFVMAMLSDDAAQMGVDDLGLAVFRFANGSLAELVSSSTILAAESSVEIFGTKGSVLLSGVDLASKDFSPDKSLKIYTDNNPRGSWTVPNIISQFKKGEFHQQNALSFLKTLINGTPPPVTLLDGGRSLEMILSAYEAANSGRTVTISYA
ncbi:MAG: Gfo/Idh/MocA family oxidoreductase [Oceanospirillaceae bacterium]|nr:Gfo/Idh/MocA family oxidoreductase [Oceanospirillaceae bacterium]